MRRTQIVRLLQAAAMAALTFTSGASLLAQGGRGGRGGGAQQPQTPRAGAPADLTGYWVSEVTVDWRWRMTTPPKGDYAGIPLNAEGKKIADAWDPAKDEAAGEQCRSYGSPNIMRVPGRIHITWQDDQTLKIEADAGQQTRILPFAAPQNAGGDWQGVSRASWDLVPVARGFGGGGLGPSGALKVVTTKFKPGYLRKNGVPYSANAVMTEFFDLIKEPDGNQYLVLSISFEDPMYLTNPYETAVHFKKQADGARWNPTPCSAR